MKLLTPVKVMYRTLVARLAVVSECSCDWLWAQNNILYLYIYTYLPTGTVKCVNASTSQLLEMSIVCRRSFSKVLVKQTQNHVYVFGVRRNG